MPLDTKTMSSSSDPEMSIRGLLPPSGWQGWGRHLPRTAGSRPEGKRWPSFEALTQAPVCLSVSVLPLPSHSFRELNAKCRLS